MRAMHGKKVRNDEKNRNKKEEKSNRIEDKEKKGGVSEGARA